MQKENNRSLHDPIKTCHDWIITQILENRHNSNYSKRPTKISDTEVNDILIKLS